MESTPQESQDQKDTPIEKKVEELKVSSEQKEESDFEPWLGLLDALEDLKIDWKSPDFKEQDMIDIFQKHSD